MIGLSKASIGGVSLFASKPRRLYHVCQSSVKFAPGHSGHAVRHFVTAFPISNLDHPAGSMEQDANLVSGIVSIFSSEEP